MAAIKGVLRNQVSKNLKVRLLDSAILVLCVCLLKTCVDAVEQTSAAQAAKARFRLWWMTLTFIVALPCLLCTLGCAHRDSNRSHRDYLYSEGSLDIDRVDSLNLKESIEKAIEVAKRCQLTTKNTPWQVMHGILAFGTGLEILDERNGKAQNALQYLTDQTQYANLAVPRELILMRDGYPTIRHTGKRYETEDHPDQFLMTCSQAKIPLDYQLMLSDGTKVPLRKLLEKTLLDVRLDKELSWTVTAIAYYLPAGARWKTRQSKEVGLEDLIQVIVKEGPDWETCGGTHSLYALSYALRMHQRKGGQMTPVWKKVEKQVREYIAFAKKYQNPDGTFAVTWCWASGSPRSADEVLHVTGHMLEWLSIAVPDRELKEEWLEESAETLAKTIIATAPEGVNYSALAHAVHGLRLYRERRYEREEMSHGRQHRTVPRDGSGGCVLTQILTERR